MFNYLRNSSHIGPSPPSQKQGTLNKIETRETTEVTRQIRKQTTTKNPNSFRLETSLRIMLPCTVTLEGKMYVLVAEDYV